MSAYGGQAAVSSSVSTVTATSGTGPTGSIVMYGAIGQPAFFWTGGAGGSSVKGGGGPGGIGNSSTPSIPGAAILGTGGGGGGGASTSLTLPSGAGGSAGGYVRTIFSIPLTGTSFPYVTGQGGWRSLAGSGGTEGGFGANGGLYVIEHYEK